MRIGLIAHDNCKESLVSWSVVHRDELARHDLIATGTTGGKIQDATGLSVRRMKSGPLGGDQQIGALIAEGALDALFFFWDPLGAHPHDPDVKALLRLAVLYDIPTACNRRSAEFVMQGLARAPQ